MPTNPAIGTNCQNRSRGVMHWLQSKIECRTPNDESRTRTVPGVGSLPRSSFDIQHSIFNVRKITPTPPDASRKKEMSLSPDTFTSRQLGGGSRQRAGVRGRRDSGRLAAGSAEFRMAKLADSMTQ